MQAKKTPQKLVSDYLSDLKSIILSPAGFFKVLEPAPDWRLDAVWAIPPIFVFANLMAAWKVNPFLILFWVPAAFLSLSFWFFVLKRVLDAFGENHSYAEMAAIGSRTSPAFFLGWIPEYGLILSFLLIAFWTYKALLHRFKMDKGAAVAAVAMPVVICGMFGMIFSYIFIWLASISTLF